MGEAGARTWKHYSILPGFGLTLGYASLYLSLIVLLPLAALASGVFSMTLEEFTRAAFSARVMASYRVTVLASLAAAAINAVFGFIVAWCLVRYRFPGWRIVDAIVDLPFALPTAVSGIVLTTLYSPNGWFGAPLAKLGVKVAYTELGIVVALVFIGLPFVVRTVAPAIEDLDPETEQAAGCLGANRWQTFVRVLLPALMPALTSGFTMAFARALGEYGSVIFIAGNRPMKTEITALLIVTKLEQFDYRAASAIAAVMLAGSFGLLMAINYFEWRRGSRHRSAA
jgi:sulfate/thiosulfate transport system permease protein